MAEKRMFAKSIVLSDAFLDMPMSARCLYFTLNMFADDDGFVGSPKGIMRQCGASQDDMRILISKRFVLAFESGVIVIKHWRINNFLRKDRHVSTTYKEELAMLELDEKGAYTESGQPMVNQWSTNGQPSIDKNSIDKNSIDTIVHLETEFEEVWELYPNKKGKSNALKAYIKARNDGVDKDTILNGIKAYKAYLDAEKVESRYIAHGSTWFNQRRWDDDYTSKVQGKTKFSNFDERNYDYDELERRFFK